MDGLTIKFIECTPDTTDIVVVWDTDIIPELRDMFPCRNIWTIDFNRIQDYMLGVDEMERDTVFYLSKDIFYFYKGR